MYIVKKACHPEPVEGLRAEAFARMLRQATHDVLNFEECGPVSLSLSKTRVERPLPAILRQAQDDNQFCYVIFSFRGHQILRLSKTAFLEHHFSFGVSRNFITAMTHVEKEVNAPTLKLHSPALFNP
jgi:hypothetical protein